MSYQIHRGAVLREYNGCCAWCGETEDLCLDHIKTQATGGGNTRDNLQILCRRCNSIKNMWTMPKLLPRQPQTDAAKIRRRQNILKDKIMPLRRRTLPDNHVPRGTNLGHD